MIAEKLRKAILQAAMQGKLTEQLPEDGNARDLLDEIQQENEQRVKAGEIRASKPPLPINPEEIPFEIPQNWTWTRFGNIAEINPRNLLNDDLMIGFLPMEAIDPGYGNNCSPTQKKWKAVKNGYTHFKDEDLLIAKITPCFQNLKSVVVSSLPNGYGAGTTELHVLRFPNHLFNNKFALNAVKSARFIEEGVGSMTGTAGQQRVGVSYVANFLIALPPKSEQNRIVDFIDRVMLIIDELEKAEKELEDLEQYFPENLKKSLLQAAMQGKLTEQLPEDGDARDLLAEIQNEKKRKIKAGEIKAAKPLPPIDPEEVPYEIPSNWTWTRLGEVGDWRAGTTPKRGTRKYYADGRIPWLVTGDLNDGLVAGTKENVTQAALDETSLVLHRKGTVLMAMYGATIGKLGILEIEATTNQACIACAPEKGVFNWYLFYYLLTARDQFRLLGAGGAQPNISKEKIVPFPFSLPSLSEQSRIVEFLDQLIPLCDSLKKLKEI